MSKSACFIFQSSFQLSFFSVFFWTTKKPIRLQYAQTISFSPLFHHAASCATIRCSPPLRCRRVDGKPQCQDFCYEGRCPERQRCRRRRVKCDDAPCPKVVRCIKRRGKLTFKCSPCIFVLWCFVSSTFFILNPVDVSVHHVKGPSFSWDYQHRLLLDRLVVPKAPRAKLTWPIGWIVYCKSRIFCTHVIFVYFVRGAFRTKINCMRKVQCKSDDPQRSATVRKFHAY